MNPKPGQIERWGKIYAHIPIRPLHELYALPEPEEYDSGVYFLWAGNQLLYIGKSRNICNRLYYQQLVNKNHMFHSSPTDKVIPFDKITCKVLEHDMVCCPCLDGNLEAYERAYLSFYKPPFNCDTQNGFT